jgi:hypothetical protein
MGFFHWFRNLFRRPQWGGWWAIRDTKVDDPEEWRRMNDQ